MFCCFHGAEARVFGTDRGWHFSTGDTGARTSPCLLTDGTASVPETRRQSTAGQPMSRSLLREQMDETLPPGRAPEPGCRSELEASLAAGGAEPRAARSAHHLGRGGGRDGGHKRTAARQNKVRQRRLLACVLCVLRSAVTLGCAAHKAGFNNKRVNRKELNLLKMQNK